ncbi:hypothetical protein BQ8482_111852 [Mesorhizobium delmotii]|uniref:Uncharacterized protein n=1 Tax=Mesorhizobium delmotii TaxID=1631247 RepID=A0A2P9AFM1_9HYPH|nr:hypothetical protein BQ8482_111852 [Mesorhizobium delmotii]
MGINTSGELPMIFQTMLDPPRPKQFNRSALGGRALPDLVRGEAPILSAVCICFLRYRIRRDTLSLAVVERLNRNP